MPDTIRKLASIQKIASIRPIDGADKIEVAMMEGLGWECVIKKGEFNVGDTIVYIEVDSIVPERAEFEFLRERRFKVRTIKLRKQISQGLIVPLSILPAGAYTDGLDVTNIIGVIKYDTQAQEEQNLVNTHVPKSRILKYLMKYAVVRKVYFTLNKIDKGDWPQWGLQKSDEERIQVCAKHLINNFDKEWYISEKIDGKSFTAFLHQSRKWGFPTWLFGICSRNIWLKTPTDSDYWRIVKKYNLEEKIKSLKTEMYLQGELFGEKIQKNKYQSELDMRVFTIVQNGKRLSLDEMVTICNQLELQTVPIIYKSFIPSEHIATTEVRDVVEFMVKLSMGKSKLNPSVEREGIVMRLKSSPQISLKIINPNFLLKYDE